MRNFLVFFISIFFPVASWAQAWFKGIVKDDLGIPAPYVNVYIKESNKSTITSNSGTFILELQEDKKIQVHFHGLNYKDATIQVFVNKGDTIFREVLIQTLQHEGAVIVGEKEDYRTEVSTEVLDVKEAELLPNAMGGIEALLPALGATQNNELSSTYMVRGGNFDENLVYVNDFEIYRPFLIRSGQQEGLSFVNPSMTKSVLFSSGGFQAKYGDKMASVLDVTYNKPKKFGGSFEGSFLGALAHVEGTDKLEKFTYNLGFRYKTNRFLYGSLEEKGQYLPSFIDIQSFISIQLSKKFRLEYLGNFALNKYRFTPTDRTTDFGLANFQARFSVFYEGRENDQYLSMMNGLTLHHKINKNISLKYLIGAYSIKENERFDIISDYFLGEVDTDPTSDNLGGIKYELGSGTFHDWARNQLNTNIIQAAVLGDWSLKRHKVLFGIRYKREIIKDKLSEWERRDSTGYSLPNTPTNELELYHALQPAIFRLSSNRFTAYIQDTWQLDEAGRFLWNYGARIQYWDVNKEVFVSPRMQFSFQPNPSKDFLINLAGGLYMQAPFYREMRNLEGQVNTHLKAQKSVQVVAGINYGFRAWNRLFRFMTEAYYKYIWDGVPYEFDNVLIRYFGKNNSKGYIAGLDLRLHGELAKGVESWISVSFLSGQEDIRDDSYTDYTIEKTKTEASGILISESKDTLSVQQVHPGNLPRPTDQRVNFALFFQDYIPKFPYIKVHMKLLVGTGLPFGPADGLRYNDVYRITPYRRFDIGFSALLFDIEKRKEKNKVPKGFFKTLEKIWVSFEVFNLFGIKNTVSYTWVDAYNPTTGSYGKFAVPNNLTNRRFNLRLRVDF